MDNYESAGCCGPVDTAAPIAVTINPEARVNVARTGTRLGTMTVGEWHTIDVTVVNYGFVTGPLAIEGEPVRGVELDLPLYELTGEHRQDAAIRVRFDRLTAADVTLTFRALGALGGLANHSTINLLLRSDSPNAERQSERDVGCGALDAPGDPAILAEHSAGT